MLVVDVDILLFSHIHHIIISTEEPPKDSPKFIEKIAFYVSFMLFVLLLPFSLFLCFVVVAEYERSVIFRLGKLRAGKPRGPGIFFVLPCIDEWQVVDLRTVSFKVPPQEVLTSDSVTVSVDAVVYYRIQNPMAAIVRVAQYASSTQMLAATTLRNVLGAHSLTELLSSRDKIAETMQRTLDVATEVWGVVVERVEMYVGVLCIYLKRMLQWKNNALVARMLRCRHSCNEQWPRRPKPVGRHEPK